MTMTTTTLDGLDRERRAAMSRYYELTDRAARARRRGRDRDATRYLDAAERALAEADRATEAIGNLADDTCPDDARPWSQVETGDGRAPTPSAYARALGAPQTGRTDSRGEFSADVATSLYRDVWALRRGEVPTTGRDTSADVRRAIAWRVVELVRHTTPPAQPWCSSARTLKALRRKQATKFTMPSPRTMADTLTADGRIGRFCSAKALRRWMGPTTGTGVIDRDVAASRGLCAMPVAYPI